MTTKMKTNHRTSLLVANASITLLALLAPSQNIHGFRPPSSCQRPRRHLRRTLRAAADGVVVASPAVVGETKIVTSPITGSETNIKYPTARGTVTDARLIVKHGHLVHGGADDSNPLLALRLSHILFASRDLAKQTLRKLTTAEWAFEDVARAVSNCAATRDAGGSVGWVDVGEDFGDGGAVAALGAAAGEDVGEDPGEDLGGDVTTDSDGAVVALGEDPHAHAEVQATPTKRGTGGEVPATEDPNEHLDLILPPAARAEVLATPTKPGDVILVTSSRGVHLVQVVDVMVDVRQLSYIKARKKRRMTMKERKARLATAAPGTMVIHNEMELANGAERSVANQLTRSEGTNLSALLEGSPRNDIDMTYKIETMGCQMNAADSERIEGQLMSLGIRPLREGELMDEIQLQINNDRMGTKKKTKEKYPDIIVLNTCSIRDHAEQKVYSYLGPHAKRKQAGEDVTIIVAGCVAQQEGQSLLRRVPEIDLVMGPQYANRIADLLEDVANGNQVVATEASHIMEDSTKPRRTSATCAWVNVIYGCNERCTYCIVPTTRGVEQSRPGESIVDEVRELVAQGFKEVTLLGQNIDAYGRDMLPKRKFSDLLRTVGAVPGLRRLRFVTSHPRYMSLGVVDAVAETPAACEYFHIPFQSGSDRVLKAMGRGHTRAKFLHIVDRVRARLPDAAITADVIVGFPGETEEDFLDTLDIMEQVKFDTVNTAAYSPRPNTPAAEWDNQLSEEVKKDRLDRINEVNGRHASERRARMMDRVVEVLVEERNVKKPTQVMGRTTHGYIVYFDGDIDLLRGELVNVKIDQCQRYYLAGQSTEEEVTKV